MFSPSASARAWRDTVDRLYREQFDRLVKKTQFVTGDAAAAEDLTQEAFVRLLHTPPRSPASALPYLRTILARLAVDWLRRQGHEVVGGALPEAAGAANPPEAAVLRQEEVAGMASALSGLSERDRQSLVMRATGFTYREIADRLGIPATQVGVVLWRAVRKVRAAHQQHEETDHPGQHGSGSRRDRR